MDILIPAPPVIPNRTRAKIVGLLVSLSLLSYFDRTIMSIAGPHIIKEFKLSDTEMGMVYSAFVVSYALLMIPGGHWVDRFGPRRVITVTGLGAALFTALTAWGGRPGLGTILGVVPALIAIRFGFGVCAAPLYPSCARMNSNWIPLNQHARVWGLVAAGAGLGGAISPLLFSWMIEKHGWRFSFCLAGAATAALILLWFWHVRDHPSQRPALTVERGIADVASPPRVAARVPHRTPWLRLLANRNLLLLAFGYGAVCYFEYVLFYWTYYYFGEVRHAGLGRSAIYTTGLFLTWMIMTPMGGLVSDRLVERYGPRLGRRLVPIVALTLSAALLCFGINAGEPFTAAAAFALALGLASCSDGPFWASAIEVGGNEVGAASGILNTGCNLGGLVGPVLTPWIASHYGWSWGLYFGSAVLMMSVLAWFFIDPTAVASQDGGAAGSDRSG